MIENTYYDPLTGKILDELSLDETKHSLKYLIGILSETSKISNDNKDLKKELEELKEQIKEHDTIHNFKVIEQCTICGSRREHTCDTDYDY